jgi:hypothetical protein
VVTYAMCVAVCDDLWRRMVTRVEMSRYNDVAPQLKSTVLACNQLLDSVRFEEALVYTLSIGNFLNAGTCLRATPSAVSYPLPSELEPRYDRSCWP